MLGVHIDFTMYIQDIIYTHLPEIIIVDESFYYCLAFTRLNPFLQHSIYYFISSIFLLLSFVLNAFFHRLLYFCIVLKRPFLSFLNTIEFNKLYYLVLTCELKPFLIFFSSQCTRNPRFLGFPNKFT